MGNKNFSRATGAMTTTPVMRGSEVEVRTMRTRLQNEDSSGGTFWKPGKLLSRALLLAMLLLSSTLASAQQVLYSEEFEGNNLLNDWKLTGDWRFKTNSACLPNDFGYVSPVTSLVFDYGSECAYRSSRSGLATMSFDIAIPIVFPEVTLEWWDFIGAELGSDFYFIDISTDSGTTWSELYRDSVDETFWDIEQVDLTAFVGQSVRFRFGFTADSTFVNAGWYIDNLRVVAKTLDNNVSAVAVTAAEVQEGDSGTTNMEFELQIQPPNDNEITIERATANGTAFAGLDYVAVSGPFTIPAQSSTATIQVQVLGDPFFEADETFEIVLSNPSDNAVITINRATGTILNDETPECLYEEDFEAADAEYIWSAPFAGAGPAELELWHIQNSVGAACGPDQQFTSPTRALVFNDPLNCNYYSGAGIEGVVEMTSPVTIPGTGALTAQLQFSHSLELGYNSIGVAPPRAYVEISNDAGGSWVSVAEFGPEAPSPANFLIPWQQETISLNQYIGQGIQARFRFVQAADPNSTTAKGWYIDDFKICYAPRPNGVSKVIVADAAANEGNFGSTPLPFPVTIDPVSPDPIVISIATAPATGSDAATSDEDYVDTARQVVIPENTASIDLDIFMLGDDQPEQDEVFKLLISNTTPNAFIVREEVTGTIVNDDTPSTFLIAPAGPLAEAAGVVNFTATISPARTVPITVNYRTVDGTAVSGLGLDYLPASGTIFFPANVDTANFSVTILDDAQFEDPDELTPAKENEFFTIELTSDSPFADALTEFDIEIVDDELAASGSTVTIDDVFIAEGSCATISAEEPCGEFVTAEFVVRVNPPNLGSISLDYSSVAISATEDVDFIPVSGTLVIPPNTNEATIEVQVQADRSIEGDEVFNIILSNPVGSVNVKDNRGVGTIQDDDFLGTTFGTSGTTYRSRNLDSSQSSDPRNLSVAVSLTAAEFRSFDFATLYGFENNRLLSIDLVSGIVTVVSDLSGTITAVLTGLAWDHTNGVAYASTDTGGIFSINLSTGATTGLTNLGTPILAMAIHPTSGRVYVVTNPGTPTLVTLIPGEWSQRNPLALSITPGNDVANDNNWDMDFDDRTQELYLNAYVENGGGDLWTTYLVDYATGALNVAFSNPLVTPLAIASSPTPIAVEWTTDLEYASTEPSGIQLTPSGIAPGDSLRVSGLGDVNGDAYEDIIITAPDLTVSGLAQAGRAWIVFGSPDANSEFISGLLTQFDNDTAVLDSLTLNGTDGFIIEGSAAGQRLGLSASGFGDVNGDGIADFGLGYTDATNTGGMFLLYGRRGLPALITAAEIVAGTYTQAVRVTGADPGDAAASTISGAGDMNGDGLADFIIGAPLAGAGASPGAGTAYIIFGSANGIGSNGLLSLGAMSSPRGLRLLGENTAMTERFGAAVSGAGDMNGDGLDDVIIGAPGDALTDTGAAYAIFGHIDYGNETDVPSTINLADLNAFLPFVGPPPALLFTNEIPDATQLAETVDPGLGAISGQSALLPGVKITGGAGGFGAAVAGLGDINGDSLDDVGVAAPQFNGAAVGEPHWGRAYIVFGDEGYSPTELASETGTPAFAGVILKGIDSGDFGLVADAERIFAGAGDLNGDGLLDILIGAPEAAAPGNTGETYVVYGSPSLTGELSLRDLADTNASAPAGKYLVAKQDTSGFSLGGAVSAAGDVNNDGITDYLSAHDGGAYLLYGKEKQVSGLFMNRMRSGYNPVGGGTGSSSVDLGENVFRGVGGTGDGTSSKPASRVGIKFVGGGFGTTLTEPSTQKVRIYREASPDLAVGDGGAADDARWQPGEVYWAVETDRSSFTRSTLEFHYRPEEIAGFDPDRVGVFYAKNTGPLTNTTPWQWLPFTHDPDRRVFIVERTHNANAQVEFNGYYALVQADLVTQLGGVIPSVGVTNDNVYTYGPEVFPPDRAFWHQRDKKLYATAPGELTIVWRNALSETVSEVKALNVWPSDDSPLFQTYVAGSPGVPLNDSAILDIKYTELRARDTNLIANAALTPRNIADAVSSDKLFVGDLTGTNENATARAFLMLSDDAAPEQGSLYFQFIRTVRWNGADALKTTSTGLAWNIGTIIDANTNPTQYGAFHDENAGAPWLLFPNAPVAPETSRYPGFYNRAARTGSIVPVNEKLTLGDNDDLVLVFYQRGGKLLDARTGNPVRDATTLQPQQFFNWPHASAKYALSWPTNGPKIVIARQDGSGEIDVATYGETLDIYFQNDSSQTGYNPNEEHAVIVPFRAGQGVFALRDDLNTNSRSKPYTLMTYYDPNDLTVQGQPRAKMLAFEVKRTESFYSFGPWPDNLDGGADPYEGDAGAFINAPFPISNFGYSPANDYISGPGWEDKNARHWARAAGDIVMKFYYPVQDDFYFPPEYITKHSDRNFTVGGSDVPWLDNANPDPSSKLPIDVTYRTDWPVDTPKINLGEILIEAKFGLPQINGQCSVDFLFPENNTRAKLIDPTIARKANLAALPTNIETAIGAGGVKTFPGLPPAANFRLSYNEQTQTLEWKGILVDPTIGFDYVLLNVISPAEEAAIRALSSDPAWTAAVNQLVGPESTTNRQFGGAGDTYDIQNSTTDLYDVLALTTGDAQSTGFVTLAFQNADACGALPVSLEIIEVVADIESGNLAVVNPSCVFEEKLTLMQTADFGGEPQNFEMQWLYVPDDGGLIPDDPNPSDPTDPWSPPALVDENGAPVSSSGTGLNQITIQGPGLLTLTDNWFSMRYRRLGNTAPWGDRWSEWTSPQLAPGWIKRVVGEINPFTQRAGGGGIEGAESSFATFGAPAPNTLVSMLSQAGPRYTGSLPLNCKDLDSFGLIPIYETVLDRGANLSIDSLSPIDNPGVNTALLLVASRISDLYMLLGNEAYADAQDPTIAVGTADGVFGAEATNIHAFMNQTSSLLEEELALLRGRDKTYAPGVTLFPVYNRLLWNFTTDFVGGEVAYALNYNILDEVNGGDGRITEADAARLYPQGHGDAWGHYLRAIKTYYGLLSHPFYTWSNRSEAVLVGGVPLTVDFIDERKFARAAAAKAQTGVEVVNLTYRDAYVEDPSAIWQGYVDEDPDRAWGFSEWSSRAGQGAYLDWVVGNAILRATDPDPDAVGITKIDRTTVSELNQVSAAYDQIQARVDEADLGQNPLGLGTNVIPFDIDPSAVDDGQTHFEQVYTRAVTSLNNAVTVFNYANNSTQQLHKQNDTVQAFQRAVLDSERDFNSRLIEAFGYPYPEDIGPGGTYDTGYAGPDLYHYMYSDANAVSRDSYFQAFFSNATTQDNGVVIYDGAQSLRNFLGSRTGGDPTTVSRPGITIGNGAITLEVKMKNYLTQIMAGTGTGGNLVTAPTTGILPDDVITVKYNLRDTGGRFGIVKPAGWTERRAPGEIQLARSDLNQALAGFVKSIDSYNAYVATIDDKVQVLQSQYNLNANKLTLLNTRFDEKKTVQDVIFGIKIGQFALRTAANIAEKVADALQESVPTVTGIIIGFSNGIIIDGLSAVRGGLKGVGLAIVESLKIIADAAELATFRLEQEEARAETELTIDTTELEQEQGIFSAINDLEIELRNESTLRIEIHTAYEAVLQASGRYQKALADAQRIVENLDIFRKQTAADVQSLRYRDMAFRIFRNDALQKYRAQFDMAQKYVYLAAKTYDYETTMLSNDPRAGRQFLTDVVKARQIGTIQDGLPQTGSGLTNSMAIMSRNFETLSTQLGFNNPQRETNRFSLRYEKFRILPSADGDENWRNLLNGDYFQNGSIGRVDNLWDVPEFVQYCVPPAGFGSVEPGLVISFPSEVVEGYNFFGEEAGGQDSSYDSTQFATKIRSVGVWFSNYDQLSLSNTPRVYMVPTGTDVMRSPSGFRGNLREFVVLDQVIPEPFPIGNNELDSAYWLPSVSTLTSQFQPIRRHGRFRAYHDSGEFSIDEVQRDSRLIGRSVWNKKWMMFIPASTFGNDRDDALDTFINGRKTGVADERDGNGITDIKLFFETYAYPRLKSGAAKAAPVEVVVSSGE